MKKPFFQHVLACFAAAAFISTLTACGGGTEPLPKTAATSSTTTTETTANNKNSTDTNIHITDESTTPTPTYEVGGYITGLLIHHSIKLLNNGTDPLLLTQDGSFTFSTALAQNANYNVTIDSRPPWRKCSIKNGQGVIAARINNIDISCDDAQGEVKTVFSNLEINNSVAINSSDEIFMRQGYSLSQFSEAQGLKFSFQGLLTSIGDHAPVAVDKTGNIFLGNIIFSSITKLTPNSNSPNGYDMTNRWAGHPNGYSGNQNDYFINYPKAMASDSSGNIYLVNSLVPGPNSSATAYRVVKIPASGAGYRSQVEDYDNAAFGTISAIALDNKDNLYLADSTNQKIWKIPAGTKTPQTFYAAGFTLSNQPVGMAFDQANNMFIAQGTRIYMIKADGPLGALRAAVVAGNAMGNVDGIGNAAKFTAATAIAIDSAGNLFVTDKASIASIATMDYTLRKITPEK